MHAYIHTYIHTCMHTCMYVYMHTCMHAYIHTYIHTYMHTCMYVYIHTYIHAYIRTYMHTYIRHSCESDHSSSSLFRKYKHRSLSIIIVPQIKYCSVSISRLTTHYQHMTLQKYENTVFQVAFSLSSSSHSLSLSLSRIFRDLKCYQSMM